MSDNATTAICVGCVACVACGETIDAAEVVVRGWRQTSDGYICGACASVDDLIERDVDDMITERVMGA